MLCAGLVALVIGGAVADRRERALRRRLERLLGVEPCASGRAVRAEARKAVIRRWAPAVSVACLAYAVVGGAAGLMFAGVAGLGVWHWWSRKAPPSDAGRTEQAGRQLPLAADLLAACVAAGAGPAEAASAVGESLGGPVGERLVGVATELRLGGEPEQCWGRLASIPEAAALARCLQRATSSGAPAADQVARVASDCRERAARSALTRAHRASVMVTAPVGLCFLPAFLVLGVVPVVVGLAGEILQGV
ncbi:type II secretion system F family protein [Streptomyces mesophilus]|uniref:type II secretion system F family protein n=1 Tax=Streptomyces mesophilus TaxID=1775132 RepID=UPI003317ACF0